MPFFHVTREDRLPSILRHGLGGAGGGKNWDCGNGVYLASDPAVGLAVMIQHYCEHGSVDRPPALEVASWRCIVVDDARIRPDLLRPDPEIAGGRSMIYDGVIDVRGMPVLAVDDVLGPGVCVDPPETSCHTARPAPVTRAM